MVNDRDDKEEGEYHFSDDDEVSYEVEPESSQQAATPGEPKQSLLARLNQSKRIIISAVVFLVLVFVVYKMVAPPTAPVESTDINAAPPVVQAVAKTPPQPPVAQQQQAAVSAAPASVVQPPPVPPVTQPVQATQQIAPVAPATNVVQGSNEVVVPSTTSVSAPPVPSTSPMVSQPSVIPSTQAIVVPRTPSTTQPQTTVPNVVTMPTVIPVQPSTVTTYSQTTTPAVTTGVTDMTTENQRLISQLQADYTQKLNEFAAQNKTLQDQMQILSTRVASMESQMNQLVQALTRQDTGAAPATTTGYAPREIEAKQLYSVQAIIPGRAWLKADNGETLTVAEGDVIKGLGRVTKIDPYNGVVEINTGNKVVSLSYGSGS